jgi:hypothetical protein
MRHKEHGVMPCAYSWEIENNQKNGWEAFEPAAATAVIEPATTEQDAQPAVAGCQKCGKVIGRGLTMHQRFCKG